jgi:hypothetical protein
MDLESGRLRLVVDGRLLEDKVHKKAVKNDWRPYNLSVELGAKKTVESTGRITDLNVFSSPLPTDQMVGMTTGGGEECGAPGDYLSWAEAEWELHSMARLETVPASEGPCRLESKLQVYTESFPWHHQCVQHCQKLGKHGRSPPVGTGQEWRNFTAELNRLNISALPNLWLSATEGDVGQSLASPAHWPGDVQAEEGLWRDFYSAEKLQNSTKPWYGSPNRVGTDSNCLIMVPKRPFSNSWVEWACLSYNKGCPCQHEQGPLLTLRGLCAANPLDYIYRPKQPPARPADLFFLGKLHTRIQHIDGQWRLTDAKHRLTGVSSATKLSYLLGNHQWTIHNDTACNKTEQRVQTGQNLTTGLYTYSSWHSYTTQLKLTGCSQTGEFTCDDGQCVAMEQRCDQLPDCRDQSDERSCRLLVLGSSYNPRIPPVTTVSATDRTIVPAPVTVSLLLLKVVSMEETAHAIQLQFQVSLQWRENRATYYNLKRRTALNALTEDEIKQLWLPLVIYDNTDQKESTRLGMDWEWSTSVAVTREGRRGGGEDFTRSGVDQLDEIEIFSGGQNLLTMTQTYTHKFQCTYHLMRYPFDMQECTIEMTLEGNDLNTVTLINNTIRMLNKKEGVPLDAMPTEDTGLSLFNIKDLTLVYRNNTTSPEKKGIKMVLVLKRKIQTELMTTYLPSALLMITTYSSTFIKPRYFDAALGLNLTIMLLMTTIFTSKIEELPPTSVTKMIDYWLIFCLMYPFLQFLLLTAIECMNDGIENKADRRLFARDGSATNRVVPTTPQETELQEQEGRCRRSRRTGGQDRAGLNWEKALKVIGISDFFGNSL